MSLGGFIQFQVPTRIVMDVGIVADISAEWERLGAKRPLIVADEGIVAAGLVEKVVAGLEHAGAEVAGRFTDVPPNSELRAVKACALAAKEQGADSFVALGGGSVIDTAKLAALLFTHGGDITDDYAGAQTVPGPLCPLVVIPTTAGTGSEVTQAAVVSDAAAHRKLSFVDENLRPHLAVLDPELTVGLPSRLTAATGMDAAVHAIEAFVDIQHGPFSDGCAVQALRMMREWLVLATREGANLEARAGMLVASTLAGISFDHSMVGVVHAMSHAFGGITPIHHGTANSILLPLGMTYNWEECGARYALLARALGLSNDTDDQRAAMALREWVAALRDELHQACELPRTLREAGLDPALAPQVAAIAEEDGASFYNPRPVEAAPIQALLEKHWG